MWLFFCNSKFALIFRRFFTDFVTIFKSSTYEKYWFFHRKTLYFTKLVFLGKIRKISKKCTQLFPKSSPNPPKIDQKSKKIDKKSHDGLISAKNAKKMRKNAKKLRKMTQHGPKSLQKGGMSKGMAVSAYPCLAY